MGTHMAVSAAIIYTASLEEPLLSTEGLLFYNRFIDDIFLVWNGHSTELDTLLDNLNNLTPTMLTWNISYEQVKFLDMVISKDVNSSKHVTSPFQKPLNRYLYIPYTSYHPGHSKRSFIKAELIRYARLSSRLSDFLDIRHNFFNQVQNRGYPKRFLLDIFSEVCYTARKSLLEMSNVRMVNVSSYSLKPFGTLCL